MRKPEANTVAPPAAEESPHFHGLNRRELDDLISLVYEQLLQLASAVRRRDPNATVHTRTLVHEAWLKLKGSPQLSDLPDNEFKLVAARAMRQVLVDSARRRGARKRGGSGEVVFVALEENAAGHTGGSRSVEVLMLDRALVTLEALNPRQAKMIEYRFFLGMNVPETAAMLAVSESVVERDWRAARAWLAGAIEQGAEA